MDLWNWWPCQTAATAAPVARQPNLDEGDQERRLEASAKFLVDEDIVVVAAENDATVSLITDVSMVQQQTGLSPCWRASPSIVFDGQVPREKTIDLHNHVLRGDWDSAGHVT